MLKREHIKHAITAIARRSAEIGYCLDELLGQGTIDVLPAERAVTSNGDFLFLFGGRLLTVRRFSFFNSGTAPIEQQLLIQYGEMAKKQEISDAGPPVTFSGAAKTVHTAGVELLLDYEIDRALENIQKRQARRIPGPAGGNDPDAGRIIGLLKLKTATDDPWNHAQADGLPALGHLIFTGVLAGDLPAQFIQFPFTRSALMQVAELNLEFFHLRFVLQLLGGRQQDRLFACLARGRIAGLVLVDFKEKMRLHSLEIRCIATQRQGHGPPPSHPVRGVGAFLVAGVWMLLKTRWTHCRDLILDSEIGAMGFYRVLGFETRRAYTYVLKIPSAYLLDHIIAQAENCENLPSGLMIEITGYLRQSIRSIARLAPTAQVPGDTKSALRGIRRSLLSTHHPTLAKTAMEALLHEQQRIPEAQELIRIATQYGRLYFKEARQPVDLPMPIVHDPIYKEHMKTLLHIESPRRLQAVDDALSDPALKGRWTAIPVRSVTQEELAWVHTSAYIERIAATTAKPSVSLDLDTQTTERSYEVACQAVGGVFALLDQVWNGRHHRGFAFVRPPGHHAEPDRGMGFCLFNNTALAARYLEHVYGVEKIMIIDIDAHHGNGTQKAFFDTDTVLYASLHQFPAYPGTGSVGEVGVGCGEGFSVNIPLEKGCRDQDFAQVIHTIFHPVAQEYAPEIILVSCGFDLYRQDRLAQMSATGEGYALMTHFLKKIADQVCGGKLVYILEGGYSVRGVEECTLHTMKELLDIPTLDAQRIQRIQAANPAKNAALRKVIDVQKKYWRSLR